MSNASTNTSELMSVYSRLHHPITALIRTAVDGLGAHAYLSLEQACAVSMDVTVLIRRLIVPDISVADLRVTIDDALDRMPFGNAAGIVAITVHHALDMAAIYDDLLLNLWSMEGAASFFPTAYVQQAFITRMYIAAAADRSVTVDDVRALVTGSCLVDITDESNAGPHMQSRFMTAPVSVTGRLAMCLPPRNSSGKQDPAPLKALDFAATYDAYVGIAGILGVHMVELDGQVYPVRLVAAGGSVLGAVMSHRYGCGNACNDIDLYLMVHDAGSGAGRCKDLALAAIRHIIRLAEAAVELAVGAPALLMCTDQAVTLTLCLQSGKSMQLQFNVRLYRNEEQLLTSYDVDPCCFVFDGTTCQATQCGWWSLLNRCAVVNPLQPSCTSRLLKYAGKGFVVVAYMATRTLHNMLLLVNALRQDAMHGRKKLSTACHKSSWNACKMALATACVERIEGDADASYVLSDLTFARSNISLVARGILSYASWGWLLESGVAKVDPTSAMRVQHILVRSGLGLSPLMLASKDMLTALISGGEGHGGFKLDDPTRARATVTTDAFYAVHADVLSAME